MGKVISFINMKGGVGKTTLIVNIGYALAARNKKRVLLVDADPQFNASTYLMDEAAYIEHMEARTKHTVLDIFQPKRLAGFSTVRGDTKTAKAGDVTLSSCRFRVCENADGYLDLIPSTLALMQIQTSERLTENRLHNFIKKVGSGYDYILIDCPPTISIYTQAAILASDNYVVPLRPDPLSTIGLPLLERWLSEFTESAGITLDSVGIIFCMVRNPIPSNMQRVMDDMRKQRKGEVFADYLSQSVQVSESVEAHKPIFIYAPRSRWGKETLKITNEFIQRT